MVAGFRRSLSLPRPNRPVADRPYHVRSTSLPCRSHPSISQLRDQIHSLKSWQSSLELGSSAWLCAGLEKLRRVHDSLDDLLHLPNHQDSLRRSRRPTWIDNLLEASLHFVDAYGTFRAALVSLKDEQLAAQVAVRRGDAAKVSAYVRTRKRIEKDVAKAATEIKNLERGSGSVPEEDAELARLVAEVNAVTILVTVTAFCGILPSKKSSSLKSFMGLIQKNKKKVMNGENGVREFQDAAVENLSRWKEEEKTVLKKMKVMEDSLVEIEEVSERVFKRLINARVSLLNVLTQ